MTDEKKKAQILGDVYNDLISIKIEMTDSYKTIMDKFYEVMRKHNIKQGTMLLMNT